MFAPGDCLRHSARKRHSDPSFGARTPTHVSQPELFSPSPGKKARRAGLGAPTPLKICPIAEQKAPASLKFCPTAEFRAPPSVKFCPTTELRTLAMVQICPNAELRTPHAELFALTVAEETATLGRPCKVQLGGGSPEQAPMHPGVGRDSAGGEVVQGNADQASTGSGSALLRRAQRLDSSLRRPSRPCWRPDTRSRP